MKKLLFTALLILTVAAGAFAKDPNKISSTILKNFEAEYKNASKVSWVVRSDYSKAEFTLDNTKMEVFYNKNAEKIATSRSISLDELPVNAKRAFAKKFEGFTVKEAIFFDGIYETAYYISGENEKEAVILKINDVSEVSIFEKTRK